MTPEKKTFTITLTEDEVVALGNLNVTLTENQKGLESIRDEVDGVGAEAESVWDYVSVGLPALRAVITQLPM